MTTNYPELRKLLSDMRYSKLAHTLYTANDVTYTRESSLKVSFGRQALQKSGEDDVYTEADESQ